MARIEPAGKAFSISANRSVRLTNYRVIFITPAGKEETSMVRAINPAQARTFAKMQGDDKGWIIDSIERARV